MSPVLTTLKTDDINMLNNARSHTDGEGAGGHGQVGSHQCQCALFTKVNP